MGLETVKVGMVGLGHVATSHLKGYASHPHAEVVAVCDLDRKRAEQFAAIHGIANVYTAHEICWKELQSTLLILARRLSSTLP
jgi:predicted dehydrogenase